MTHPMYLVIVRENEFALSVATALEERPLTDGRSGRVLVLAPLGPDLRALAGGGNLRPMALAAYVRAPRDSEWRVLRWDDDAGAVAMARWETGGLCWATDRAAEAARGVLEAVRQVWKWHQPRHRRPAAEDLQSGRLRIFGRRER